MTPGALGARRLDGRPVRRAAHQPADPDRVAAPAVVVVLGIVAIIISALQAVLMLFRQGALVVLAGALPLAAAGTLTPATRPWFQQVTGWMLALIFYKPAAAAVYATAFTMIGTGKDPRTVLMGFAMVLLSLVALPVLMQFFTWTAGQVATSSGGGGFLQAALGGAVAVGALRGLSGGQGGAAPPTRPASISAQLGPPRRAERRPGGRRRGPARRRARTGRQTWLPAPPAQVPLPGAAAAAAARPGSPARAGGRRARRRPARQPRRCSPRRREGGSDERRTNRRRPGTTAAGGGGRGIGLFGLGTAGTFAVLAAVLVLILVAAVDASALVYVAPPVLAAGGLGLARIGGEPLALRRAAAAALVVRVRPQTTRSTGPPWSPGIPPRSPCPGCWHPLRCWTPRTATAAGTGSCTTAAPGMITATLRVIPASTWLADRADADSWVAGWGGWLASLGYLPAVRWVTVTIDTAPEPGSALADAVAGALDPAAPLAARQIMGQLVERRPRRRRRRGHPGQHHVRPEGVPVGARRA